MQKSAVLRAKLEKGEGQGHVLEENDFLDLKKFLVVYFGIDRNTSM